VIPRQSAEEMIDDAVTAVVKATAGMIAKP
jgi:hypothetical protein